MSEIIKSLGFWWMICLVIMASSLFAIIGLRIINYFKRQIFGLHIHEFSNWGPSFDVPGTVFHYYRQQRICRICGYIDERVIG